MNRMDSYNTTFDDICNNDFNPDIVGAGLLDCYDAGHAAGYSKGMIYGTINGLVVGIVIGGKIVIEAYRIAKITKSIMERR